MLNVLKKNKKGQVILEFTFSLIVIMLLLYGTMMVFRWSGVDLADRIITHNNVLINGGGSLDQINPYFYKGTPMNSMWDGI